MNRRPVIRTFSLPNGDKIVSLRESTLQAGLRASNNAIKEERNGLSAEQSAESPLRDIRT